ncbi:MAG: PAS domain S-box protein [Acidobacteria bacterium]|nr:PAS domain S-box protein [Acidobacteriota bacterium]
MTDWEAERNRMEWAAPLGDTDLLAVLLEHGSEAFYVVDTARRILFWNTAAADLTGYQWHEVGGHYCQDDLLMHTTCGGAALCGAACPLREVMSDGHTREAHVYLRHKHGHRIPVLVRARAIRRRSGEIAGAVEFFAEEPPASRRALPFLDVYGCQDAETGAAVRQYGELRVRQNLDELQAFGVPFGWLRVGLDGAESLEGKFGYAAVAQAVALVARTIERLLSVSDLLVRWDPTEFRVVASNVDATHLMELGRGLAIAVGTSNLRWWGDALGITISLGGASAEVDDSLEALEERASEAFEISRTNGGNRASFHGWQDSDPFSVLT